MPELLSVITFDPWQIFVAACNLLIMFVILRKLLFSKVKDFIDARENEVRAMYDDAEKASSEANKLKTEYEANIAAAKDKALEIVNEATVTASKRSDVIIAEANKEAINIKDKAFDAIELEKKKAVLEIKSDISTLVTEAASKVIEKEIDENTHKKLIDDFIGQVGA